MKKFHLLCLMLCASLWSYAQVTHLTIDNQTPGWLSSKIDYVDQQKVTNLTITGYINDKDLNFIGSLFAKQNLKVLDLADANMIGTKNDYWNGGMGGYEYYGYIPIQKLILPHSLKEMDQPSWLIIDSLIIDTKINKIEALRSKEFQYLLLGENVDSIMFNAFANSKIKSLSLPSSLKYVGELAFHNVEFGNMSFICNDTFRNVEYIGREAFVNRNNRNGESLPDTLIFPKIKEYGISAFDYKEGMHIYLGKNIKQIDYVASSYQYWNPTFANATFHIESLTPPATNTYNIWNQGVNVYVPKEAVEEYKVHQGWKYANIHSEPRPLQRIIMDCHELFLEIGELKTISLELFPNNPDDTNILWSSENEQIAKVDEKGNVTAITYGTTKIIASSSDKTTADTCVVLVKRHTEDVSLSDSSLIFNNVGDSMLLKANVQPIDATNKSVIWTSSDNAVCTVTNSGLVTAIGPGTAIITVTTVDGGHTATCVVKVLQHVSNISIDKHYISLKVEEKYQIEAKVTPDDADEKKLIWNTTDEKIVSVSENGLITALKTGEAWIKVTSVDNPNAKDSCLVNVNQPVIGITLSEIHHVINSIGESVQLKATVMPENASNKKVTWKSSDEKVCTVVDGKVTATGEGKATITATTEDGGFTATCAISVEINHPVTSISLNRESYTMHATGETIQLKATILPSYATNKKVTWTSSNTNVCTVANGLVTATGEGKATITATTEDGGFTATCVISVEINHPVTDISLNYDNYVLSGIGESVQLKANILPENATNKDVTWKSYNENVCIVNKGLVIGIGYGTAVVSVTTVDGNHMATCTITVEDNTPVNSIGANNQGYKVYSLQGREQTHIQKGLNIIRFNDGTVKKVMVK